MKYSDQLAEWLVELGYTHCFYVAGGNVMHILESCSRHMTCLPVVHEVTAGIAAEYFNEAGLGHKAFALVTAGPGITNITTAIAAAFLESRELLVIGGQVKTADLSRGKLRQRGIQEIDGVSLVRSITVEAVTLEETVDGPRFANLVRRGTTGRKGPVFIELPLDIQARDVERAPVGTTASASASTIPPIGTEALDKVASLLGAARRPVLLLGGGIDRGVARQLLPGLTDLGVPLTTTWNGADRVPADHPLFMGRPNTWGQRSANLVLQQADLVLALGTRLGLQQTGFNWQQFVPKGKVVQVDCDPAELSKGHPRIDFPLLGDANTVLAFLARQAPVDIREWVSYCAEIRDRIPLSEPVNQTRPEYFSPYEFGRDLSRLASATDMIVPCSSGSAFTVMMQAFVQKSGQTMITNKGLASMGYGLGGAIGAALAGSGRRTILVEGDGGFAQNLQEIGTAAANNLNIKIFIFDDNGYASIRMTQRSYFGGRYVGCDRSTGLGLPNWDKLFAVYDVPTYPVAPGFDVDPAFIELFDAVGFAAFLVRIDPDQTYFPKITSRITETGNMESNPLHKMSPPLDADLEASVARYLVD